MYAHAVRLDYGDMADETLALAAALRLDRADLVGWSDGAIVALLAAVRAPGRVGSVVSISGNIDGDHLVPDADEWVMSAAPADLPIPDGYQGSPDGIGHWPVVAQESLDMWRRDPGLSLEDLAGLHIPVLYLCGDHDLVALEHTTSMFRATPEALLGVVPRAGHGMPVSHAPVIATFIREFLGTPEPD